MPTISVGTVSVGTISVGKVYARTIQIILVCLYATPKVAWTGIENLYSVFLRPEKNLASLGVFHPNERLVEVRKNTV